MARLRVAAAQITTVVGDLAGNVDRILTAIKAAEDAGADLVALPELALSGDAPEGVCGACTANGSCPTTASSTRPATSPRARTPAPSSSSTASGWPSRSAR